MKTARIAIFLTGVIGLGMGGLMSLTSIQSQQEEAVLRNNEVLKTQAQGFVDQFFGVIEAVRTGANPNYVTNKFSVKMIQGIPSEIESSKLENIDLALEDRLLNSLKKQVNLSDLRLSKYTVGTYDLSDIGNKSALFLAVPSETDAEQNITKINVTLIDPVQALTSFPKVRNSKLDRNAYLVDKNGKVLAHSSDAYLGADLRKTDGLRSAIENLFIGAPSGILTNYRSIDGTKEQVVFVRAGTLPFAVGMEQRAIPAVLSVTWLNEQMNSGAARKGLGMIFVVMALALAMFSGVSIFFNRRIQNELKLSKFQNKIPFAEPLPESNMIYVDNEKVLDATENFINLRNQINEEKIGAKISVHRDYAEELSAKLRETQSADEVERTLTSLTSEMSESATMFFSYNRRLQNLTLSAIAGNVQVQNSALFQSYIRKDIEEQVESFATEGKVASLNNYGPMNKLMITHLNVAHFEAWAITSEAEVSGTPKMLGVLVILNAGFRSAQSRPILSKMLRNTGNYLFAQTNKISARTRSINPNAINPSELNS